MHYKDGQPAKIGDLVKGTSYNMDGVAIVGTVIQLTPAVGTCDLVVATAEVAVCDSNGQINHEDVDCVYTRPRGGVVGGEQSPNNETETVGVTARYDFGQCDRFELIFRPA